MDREYKSNSNKGFSLVELVIVILVIAILALAVFAGGSVVVKKSQVSRTISDLHNFSIAIESTLNENPNAANITTTAEMDALLNKLNANLPEDYRFKTSTDFDTARSTGNIQWLAPVATTKLYISDKTDSWGNNYYLLMDCNDSLSTRSEFVMTVISAGPNAQTNLNSTINEDDIYLVGHYVDGDVTALTYNHADAKSKTYNGSDATVYTAANRASAPSNFKFTA